MNELESSTVLVHNPDTTVLQCRQNTAFLHQYCRGDLIGKKLADLGFHFLRADGTRLPLKEHPLNLAIRRHCCINGTILGLFDKVSRTTVWTKVETCPHFDQGDRLISVTTIYSRISETSGTDPAATLCLPEADDWKKTFDAMPEVIIVLAPDYRIIHANRLTYTTFHLEDSAIAGKYCYHFLHDRDAPCDNCPIGLSGPGMMPPTGLVYSKRLNKTFEVLSAPVLNEDGSVKFLVHTARDVTRKLMDESERTLLAATIEQTTEAIVITDRHGAIQYINPTVSRTSGYTREELLGQNICSPQYYDHSNFSVADMCQALEKGKVWQGRLVSKRKAGSLFEEDATISPVFDSSQKISNFIAVKRDITEEELLKKQLHQAMKMEAIGTLAGGIAHDFNNILAAMIGYGQIAKGRLAKDDPVAADIEQILTAGDRAANLVKQILTFSRTDKALILQPLRVQYVAGEVLKLLRSSLPTTIRLEDHIDHACGPILADPNQIHQILMNLCTNAKQAISGTYGRLRVELRQIKVEEPRILSGTAILTSGSYLDLMVEDNGCGMSSDTMQRIFDPFFTTKPKDQGTGLGLSVVHGIVKKHGGQITVSSRLEQGTTFHVYFPIVAEETPVDDEVQKQDRGGTERIMVVDDEPVLAQMLWKMLTTLGYKVSLFTDSLQAVHEYRNNPYEVDVVLTDMTMPNMTGAELAREVLSLRPELPVIMMTGFSEIIDREKAERIGIRVFMLKPLKKKDLSRSIRKVLEDGKYTCN